MTSASDIATAITAIDQTIRERLLAEGIYEVDAYGWLDADTIDPEYIGHAMWQVNPPFEPDFNALMGKKPVQERPSTIQRDLNTAGADWEGLMKSARLAAGLMLVYQPTSTCSSLNLQSMFWLHHTTCVLMLSMASDRLRDFIVCAATGERIKKYVPTKEEQRHYAVTFSRVRTLLQPQEVSDPRISEILDRLGMYTPRIEASRTYRNKLVHDIATQHGFDSDNTARQQSALYDGTEQIMAGSDYGGVSIKEFSEMVRSREHLELQKFRGAIDQVKSWYCVLMEASNLTFELENILRRLRSNRRQL